MQLLVTSLNSGLWSGLPHLPVQQYLRLLELWISQLADTLVTTDELDSMDIFDENYFKALGTVCSHLLASLALLLQSVKDDKCGSDIDGGNDSQPAGRASSIQVEFVAFISCLICRYSEEGAFASIAELLQEKEDLISTNSQDSSMALKDELQIRGSGSGSQSKVRSTA